MTTRRQPRKRPTRPPRGVVLAAALACLFLAILLSASLAVSTLDRHRRLQNQARDHQAAWLAASAAERAAAQLRQDPRYSGETWTVSAKELGGRHGGKAVITVGVDENDPQQQRVTIEAYYPDHPIDRMRVVREITLQRNADDGDNPE